MGRNVLVVNVGSTSKKYSLYFDDKQVFNASFQNYNNKFLFKTEKEKFEISKKEYVNSANYILKYLISFGLIEDFNNIIAVGFRVVAPGKYFIENRIIDSNYIKKLKENLILAPLHIKPLLEELLNLRKTLSKALFIGVSDSNFHKNMDELSKIYAINLNTAEGLGIYRYGYHGISLQSLMNQVGKLFRRIPKRIIICHLGGGSSVTAIKNGKSFDTSMGFTPLEGVFGGSRSGNIDLSAALYLGKKLKINLEDYFNSKSGFLGLTGKEDLRDVLDLFNKGDKNSKLALDLYSYNIKKYIGSYFASLNGLDLLVFTGAIGEHSEVVRSKICDNLNTLGILLDKEKNKLHEDGFINSKKSKVKVLVLSCNESKAIFKVVNDFI